MKSHIFEGSGVALITPMDTEGRINYDKLEELIEMHVSAGTDALILAGTTGEASCLSQGEHYELIDFASRILRHRRPLIAGAGSNCTHCAQELCRSAEKAGADALLLVTPYYNKCSQKGLFYHYKACSDWTNLPFILYNIPGRTGVNILPGTYEKLLEIPNVTAVKEASGNFSQIAEIAAEYKDDLDIYCGNDDQIVPTLSIGGRGVISVLANICPEDVHRMCRAYFDGQTKESMDLQLKYKELIQALFSDVNPIPVKAAMEMIGRETGGCRLPLCPMSPEGEETLKQCLYRYGLCRKDKMDRE